MGSQGSGFLRGLRNFLHRKKKSRKEQYNQPPGFRIKMAGRTVLPSAADARRPKANARSASMDTIDFHIPQIINVRRTRRQETLSTTARRSESPEGYEDEASSSTDSFYGRDHDSNPSSRDDDSIDIRVHRENLAKDADRPDDPYDVDRDLVPLNISKLSTVIDPTDAQSLKNITIELEMEVRDDLEEPIEEFCRLWRLGRFKDAELYFAANLTDHMHKESVRIPYGEMLLARGDYGAFAKIRGKEGLDHASWDGTRQHPADRPYPFLQLLWGFRDLTKIFDYSDNRLFGAIGGRFTTVHDLDNTFGELHVPEWAFLVNKKLLPYYLKLAQGSKFSLESFTHYIDQIHWRGIYEAILSGGRIWELRDAISLMSHIVGDAEQISASLFGTSNVETMFSKLLDDWRLESYDEATEMALLDIYVTLLHKMHIEYSRKGDSSAVNCLTATKRLANHIMRNDPECMRSRPFLRYALFQVSLRIYEARHDKFVTSPPASMMWAGDPDDFQLEISIPKPGGPIPLPSFWTMKDLPVNTLTVILNGARELGDYRLEADCLKHLALAVEEPQQYLEELTRLQRDIQHDEEGYLHTLLASTTTLVPVTRETWQQVLSSLLVFDKLPNKSGMEISPTLLWIKAMITSWLVEHSRPDDSWKEETKKLAPFLQGPIRRCVEDLGLDLSSVLAPEPAPAPEESFDKRVRRVQERYITQLERRLESQLGSDRPNDERIRELEERSRKIEAKQREKEARRNTYYNKKWEEIERRPKRDNASRHPPPPPPRITKTPADDADSEWPATLYNPFSNRMRDKGNGNAERRKPPSITWQEPTEDGKTQSKEPLLSVDGGDGQGGNSQAEGQRAEPGANDDDNDDGPTVESLIRQ
ncbi:hypothetical protein B0T16DRAFT_73808 [Cercophora newfieldiana]|uniref:Uncharacterized protein n=1 Tax=Cercophora newfieldiana TaxID=92897 RepID=A0AA39YGQ0_9PEZI|nr:hypothetical protein B0T16DRAFT_73808 [Cercophora newfieldiana]